ncbi:MAG TPA: ribosome maturation factor RimM [Candidatus Angelobacter sp.]|nr:ribosome maturation factor RimM [Candidatus Angelobacter sp.]
MNRPSSPGAGRGEEANGDFIAIARVTKTQGRKGEVAALLLTDFPERFATRKRLFLAKDGRRRKMELEDHWFHKGGVVLKFLGVDSISQAEELAGCEVQIPRAERAELESGSVYVADLVGCTVSDSGREIGRIEDVQFGAGEAPLLVIRGEKEYLVPFAEAYIARLAPAEKRLEMKLPEGMLELDAPLSKEEKQRQTD